MEKKQEEHQSMVTSLSGLLTRTTSEPNLAVPRKAKKDTESATLMSTEAAASNDSLCSYTKVGGKKRKQEDDEASETQEDATTTIWGCKEFDELLNCAHSLVKQTIPANTKDNVKGAIKALESSLIALENKRKLSNDSDNDRHLDKLRVELNEKENINKLLYHQLLEKEELNKQLQEHIKQLEEAVKQRRTPEEIKQAEEEERCQEIWNNLQKAENADQAINELAKEWPRKAYRQTRIVKSSILGDREVRALLVQDKNAKDMEVIKRLTQYFPAAPKLAELTVGKVGMLKISQEEIDLGEPTTASRDVSSHSTRTLIVGKIGEEENPKAVLKTIEMVIDKMSKVINREWKTEESRRRGALHITEGTNPELARKATEYWLQRFEGEIDLCLKKKAPRTERRTRGPQKPKTGSIIINTTGDKTQAEWSSILQRDVDTTRAGVTVTNIVYPREGGIKVLYRENQKGATTSFLDSIRNKTSLQATESQPSMKIRVLGINNEVSKDTIEQAVRKALNLANSEAIVIEEPRQNKMGKWGATVLLEKRKAEALLAKRRLTIGWVSYPLIEWVVPPCCFKCQKIGHWERECKESKVADIRCHKCGTIGHAAKTCDKNPKCYNCKEGDTGHAANSMECPAYRQCIRNTRDRKSEVRGTDSKQGPKAVQLQPNANEQSTLTEDNIMEAAIAGDEQTSSAKQDDDGFVPYKKTMKNPRDRDANTIQNDAEQTAMHTD